MFELTHLAKDMGMFRAPSLRNVDVTGPYMHDGNIATLPEVLAFYAAGGRHITSGPHAGDGRASPLKNDFITLIDLNAQEQADIVAFYNLEADHDFLTNPRFADRSPHRPNLSLSRSARHLPRWRLAWALALGLCASRQPCPRNHTHSGLPGARCARGPQRRPRALGCRQQRARARLGGTLDLGDTPNDLRGGHLEHATLGLGVRLLPQLGANVTMGWHGNDQRHVETAWLHAQPSADSPLSLGAGRNRVPIGPVLRNAGHLERYGQMPLAKRATFNGDWIDDGINATWRPQARRCAGLAGRGGCGAVESAALPGSTGSDWAPVLHLGARWGQASVDAFYSHLRPRGAAPTMQSTTSGHVHTAPACEASLRGITCFDGQVDLLGGNATWHTPLRGVQAQCCGAVAAQARRAVFEQWRHPLPWRHARRLAGAAVATCGPVGAGRA